MTFFNRLNNGFTCLNRVVLFCIYVFKFIIFVLILFINFYFWCLYYSISIRISYNFFITIFFVCVKARLWYIEIEWSLYRNFFTLKNFKSRGHYNFDLLFKSDDIMKIVIYNVLISNNFNFNNNNFKFIGFKYLLRWVLNPLCGRLGFQPWPDLTQTFFGSSTQYI